MPVKVELEQKPVEYEYVNVSTNTEYKEAVPLNNDELKENKKLENVVKKVKKSDPKPIKDEVIEPSKEQINKEEKKVVKSDPKPIKEKDDEDIKVKIKKEEKKVVKSDPKPIKEKDDEEIESIKILKDKRQ